MPWANPRLSSMPIALPWQQKRLGAASGLPRPRRARTEAREAPGARSQGQVGREARGGWKVLRVCASDGEAYGPWRSTASQCFFPFGAGVPGTVRGVMAHECLATYLPACKGPSSRQLPVGGGKTQLESMLCHHLTTTTQVTLEPGFSHL